MGLRLSPEQQAQEDAAQQAELTRLRTESEASQLRAAEDPLGTIDISQFSSGQEPFVQAGRQAVATQQESPEFTAFRQFVNQQAGTTQEALPGVQAFIQQEEAAAQARRDAELAQRTGNLQGMQDALARLQQLSSGQQTQNLSNIFGTSGTALSPELQGLVDRERDLSIQRANLGVGESTAERASQLTSQLASRGLSGSSVASRGIAQFQQDALRQQENARLAAEQQALQREGQLRQLGLQSRGQDISGNLGLLQQLAGQEQGIAGLNLQAAGQSGQQLSALDQLVSQFGAPSELATLQQLAAQGAQPQGQFAQQQFQNELDALRLASGQQAPSGGSGLAGALGGLASSAIGNIGEIGKFFSDKTLKEDMVDGTEDIGAFLDSIKPTTYKYKGGDKKFHGIIAQDLEKTVLGKKHVEETPLGKLVNFENLGTIVAAQGQLNKRLKTLEKKGK